MSLKSKEGKNIKWHSIGVGDYARLMAHLNGSKWRETFIKKN